MAKLTLSKGNSKIGHVINFSLPSKITCPGKTEWCDKHCYAARIERMYPNVKKAWAENFEIAKSDNFVKEMTEALKKIPKKYTVIRIHVSGDFFNEKYIRDWIEVIKAHPNLSFYAYTKAWRVPKMLDALEDLTNLLNMTLFASTDISTKSGVGPIFMREAFAGDNKPIMKDRTFTKCPAQGNIAKTCDQCKLCSKASSAVNIFFKTH